MLFNDHSNLKGLHAFLSASSHHWVNYTDEKLAARLISSLAAQRGTELHAFAHEAIRLGVKLPSSKKTLNMYVNDGIGYRMTCEQTFFYSVNAFGTADTASFRKNVFRCHDLKTGITHTSVTQLEVYGALFCLEYGFKPHDISFDLRIYQNDEIQTFDTDPDSILHIMDKIKMFDPQINEIRERMA